MEKLEDEIMILNTRVWEEWGKSKGCIEKLTVWETMSLLSALERAMKLTEKHITEIKAAAERIGEYGKITFAVSGGVVDIITEGK
jgi:hypothetical protein